MKKRLLRTVRPLGVGRETGPLTGVPTDLVVTAGFVLAAAALLAVLEVSSPVVRAAVGVPLLFLAPGYAVVSLLFPRARGVDLDEEASPWLVGQTQAISDVERAALAFGLSFAVVPLLGLGLTALSWELSTTTVVGTVAGFALLVTLLAAVRRVRVTPRERYSFGLERKLGRLRAAIFGTSSPVTTAVNVVLVISVLLALTTVAYGLAVPQSGEQYTDLRLHTDAEDGEYVVGDLPDEVDPGDPLSFVATVENQEGEAMEYTAVVQEQWVDESGTVLERTDLQQLEYSVGDGATAHGDLEVTPEADAGEVRIVVMLFDGDGAVPDEPATDDAYRYAHFWTEIEDTPGEE
ncbi:DUF1616 domain-containing protein [Halobiforma nitratireducens]|uniref:DUF1616 domain-containing protein n=1 Tax=Halobiforma nitratireducens JCM 10879 TaxID=1227454 RepID=M0LZF8_9EURY|nr:DUF1616 domain-containing protein [Halobiforma nitratireducens]EMA38957.1 hypothetical protein C446_09203 [Halobiforma nitratireducens JCM 10879]